MGQAIYVKKNQADEESLEDALTVLRSGGMIALAPEGTRSRTGGLLRGRTGVAWLATQVDVPVIPLAAWGQEKWRERGKRLSRIPIRVRAGAPLHFLPGAATPDAMRQYTDRIMNRIAELLPPEYRGVYANPE
jgi:1-acyl-sn-glycerol-3-phosphate acyltransferase